MIEKEEKEFVGYGICNTETSKWLSSYPEIDWSGDLKEMILHVFSTANIAQTIKNNIVSGFTREDKQKYQIFKIFRKRVVTSEFIWSRECVD